MADRESPDSAACWRARLLRALAEPLDEAERAPGETRHEGRAMRHAGVLVPIVGGDEPFIYFTQRSDRLRHHPGQISFPGGSVEARDASHEAAALREAQEEIGLAPERVEILGRLPAYRTVTGFSISPFVGWVDPAAEVAADHVEVARLFGVPLAYALDHQRFRREPYDRNGRRYEIYSIDYRGDRIWGATAGMLYGLLQRLGHIESRDTTVPLTAARDRSA